MQNDYLTTSLKKNMREHAINRLIKKIGKYLGIEDIDCRIEIHGMSTMEYSSLTELIIQRFQVGLISREEAIARLDRISIEEAQEMAKKIEAKEQKEFNNDSDNKNNV